MSMKCTYHLGGGPWHERLGLFCLRVCSSSTRLKPLTSQNFYNIMAIWSISTLHRHVWNALPSSLWSSDYCTPSLLCGADYIQLKPYVIFNQRRYRYAQPPPSSSWSFSSSSVSRVEGCTRRGWLITNGMTTRFTVLGIIVASNGSTALRAETSRSCTFAQI